MARVSIPQNSQDQPRVDSGTYGQDGSCRIVGAEIRTVPGNNPEGEEFLSISVLIPSPTGAVFARTSAFGKYHTRTTEHSGSCVWPFVEALGEDPNDFDDETLIGKDVVVTVETRQLDDGRTFTDITNIAKLG